MSRPAGALVLRREDDGRVLCERCILADTVPRRLRGLLGRRELPSGEGIVIRPGWSIHTAFMRFPIDVVFVDADQVVVKIVPDLKPWRSATRRGARDVVELTGGECARRGLKEGDRVTWAARVERPPAAAASSADSVPAAFARNGRPTRVLLGTADVRFLRMARFLLTRDDLEVEATKKIVNAIDLVERHRPDVVVIDATDSLGDAARTVAAVEALHPNVGVVVVCDGEPPRWTTGLKVTEKWAALQTLADDVRQLAADARVLS
jgi:uncharacterized membrane protein (UPF0127 family)